MTMDSHYGQMLIHGFIHNGQDVLSLPMQIIFLPLALMIRNSKEFMNCKDQASRRLCSTAERKRDGLFSIVWEKMFLDDGKVI